MSEHTARDVEDAILRIRDLGTKLLDKLTFVVIDPPNTDAFGRRVGKSDWVA